MEVFLQANNGMIVNDAHTEYAMKGQAQVDWQEIYKNHPANGECVGPGGFFPFGRLSQSGGLNFRLFSGRPKSNLFDAATGKKRKKRTCLAFRREHGLSVSTRRHHERD